MTHLNAQEFVEYVEDGLRGVVREARELVVPEPSPLFWDHLSRRITRAVEGSAPPVSLGWRVRLFPVTATAAAIALAAVVGISVLRDSGNGAGDVVVSDGGSMEMRPAGSSEASGEVAVASTQVDTEADWTLVLRMAETVEWEETDTDALLVDRQMLDGAVLRLSAEERRELTRLLDAELSGTTS